MHKVLPKQSQILSQSLDVDKRVVIGKYVVIVGVVQLSHLFECFDDCVVASVRMRTQTEVRVRLLLIKCVGRWIYEKAVFKSGSLRVPQDVPEGISSPVIVGDRYYSPKYLDINFMYESA